MEMLIVTGLFIICWYFIARDDAQRYLFDYQLQRKYGCDFDYATVRGHAIAWTRGIIMVPTVMVGVIVVPLLFLAFVALLGFLVLSTISLIAVTVL